MVTKNDRMNIMCSICINRTKIQVQPNHRSRETIKLELCVSHQLVSGSMKRYKAEENLGFGV
jgi:hypothetical protein